MLRFNGPLPMRRAAALATLALLGACTSFSPDGGFGPAEQAARQLGHELRRVRSPADQQALDQRVAQLLAQPLSVDDAVQLALFNHQGLQATFQELGLSEAELVRAGRPPNPAFDIARLRRGEELEIERSLHWDLAGLLALPLRRQGAARRFQQVQQQVALEVLALAADTRSAYFHAVAAGQAVQAWQQAAQAADAGADLARRMVQAGNWSALQAAREQAFQAEAGVNLVRARQAQVAARERLTRRLGLAGDPAALPLPDQLPELPAAPREAPDVERVAMTQRLDVQAARLQVEATARDLGLTQVTRFIDGLELGVARNSSNQAPVQHGPELRFELPLFDWGGARAAQAEALYLQSVHRAAQTAVAARSQVREAYGGYRSAYDIARRYRDDIVPTARRISDENLLRYNGMLIGVFELLADARAQIASVNAAIGAQRDFWIASADLDLALVGPLALPAAAPAAARGDMAPH